MRLDKWWTLDTVVVTVLGAMMAVVLIASLFVRPQVSLRGSALVPAAVLQDARNYEAACQTVTDDEVSTHAHTRC